jgi:hypothetical protein
VVVHLFREGREDCALVPARPPPAARCPLRRGEGPPGEGQRERGLSARVRAGGRLTSLCAAWPPSIRTASSRAYSFRTRCAPPSALQACARPNALPRLRFLLRCWALTRAPKQIPNYPEANLPTILVYKDHDIALQLVTLAQLGGLEGLGTRRDAQASRARARLCAAGSGRPREQPRVPLFTLSLRLRRTHASDSPGLAVCTARGGEKLLQRALAKASGPALRPAANQLPPQRLRRLSVPCVS